MKGCVIAAPMTGSGKTTVTLGLLAALRAGGYAVQPFKIGPDFIDPGLHAIAAGVPSHNLDGWMLPRETNVELFSRALAARGRSGVRPHFQAKPPMKMGPDPDLSYFCHGLLESSGVAVVEGMMGLFDGFSGASDSGSTAEMAKWLDLPVILVVDTFPLARSVAALIHGFQTFDPELKVAGVILNRVAGEGHFQILRDAIKDTPILGWLPPDSGIQIQERHLGLLTGEEDEARRRIEQIGGFFSRHINIQHILDVLPEMKLKLFPKRPKAAHQRVRVALARDPAFSFYYEANRTALEAAGAEIVEFSVLHDAEMPAADFLYIGGGYPELYREKLEANVSMRESVRRFVESGKRFYAECGGLMYLSRAIEGRKMVGVLPTDIQLTDRPVDFGYCEVTTTRRSILGPAGTQLRGHQFHYSKCTSISASPVYAVTQGSREYCEGWGLSNGLASYVHLHFLSNPDVVRSVLES